MYRKFIAQADVHAKTLGHLQSKSHRFLARKTLHYFLDAFHQGNTLTIVDQPVDGLTALPFPSDV